MSSTQIQRDTGISPEHIREAARRIDISPWLLREALDELQQLLQERAPDMVEWGEDLSHAEGQYLLLSPLEQHEELLEEELEYAAYYALGTHKAHQLEAEQRRDELPAPERDLLWLVQ